MTDSADMTQMPLFQWFFGPVVPKYVEGEQRMAFHYEFKYICASTWVVPFRLEGGKRKDVLLQPVLTDDLDLCAWEFKGFRDLTPGPYCPPVREHCPTCGM